VSLRVDCDGRAIDQVAASWMIRRAFARSWTRSTDWPTIPGPQGACPASHRTGMIRRYGHGPTVGHVNARIWIIDRPYMTEAAQGLQRLIGLMAIGG
jgi:hypothetical protein